MARGATTSTLTAQTDNIKAIETIDGRTGGNIRPELIAPSPRRRQRRLHSKELPSAGRAGSGFPKIDRSRNSMGVAQNEPYDSARVVEGRSVIRGRVRCRSRFVARERRRRELEYKPVIDTARSTAGEGHVACHGDVRRVRKVHVDSPTSRTLRGQTPAQTSSRYMRRTETVRNRLTQKPTTKPLPQPVAKAQTQEPRNRRRNVRGQSP